MISTSSPTCEKRKCDALKALPTFSKVVSTFLESCATRIQSSFTMLESFLTTSKASPSFFKVLPIFLKAFPIFESFPTMSKIVPNIFASIPDTVESIPFNNFPCIFEVAQPDLRQFGARHKHRIQGYPSLSNFLVDRTTVRVLDRRLPKLVLPSCRSYHSASIESMRVKALPSFQCRSYEPPDQRACCNNIHKCTSHRHEITHPFHP